MSQIHPDTDTTGPEPRDVVVKRSLAIAAIAIGYILNPLNGSLVVTAYPQFADVFDVPYSHVSALVMYYLVATAVALPLAGGLGDFFGRKNIFLGGVSGFIVSSVFAGFSGDFNELVIWRVIQSVFSGVILANGIAMVAQVAPPRKIGSYVAILNAMMVASTATGFPLGGVLLQAFDWRVLFWINAPVGLVALVLAIFFVPKDSGSKVKFTALSFLGVPFLPVALGLQALIQGDSIVPYIFAFLMAFTLVALGIVRSASSRLQLSGISNLRFNLGCLVVFLVAGIQFALMFTFPAWTLVALDIESGVLGLYLSGLALTQLVVNPVIGKVLDTYGEQLARLAALVTLAVATLIMAFVLNRLTFAVALVILGFGLASTQLIAQRASLMSSPRESHALAMGIFNSYRYVGGLSGNALAALILAGVQITPQSGVAVMGWSTVIFMLPLIAAMLALREPPPAAASN